jgi:hypothetical protein
MTTPSRRAKSLMAPKNLFARAIRIHVGRVEEIDPGLQGAPDERPALIFGHDPAVVTSRRVAITHAANRDPVKP